jgi:hypothetical protein
MKKQSKPRSPQEMDKAMASMHEVLKKAMPNSQPQFKGLIGELGDSNSSAVFLGMQNSLSQPAQ